MSDTTITTDSKLVTFIITTYNLPVSMLRQCIDSIFQTSLSKNEREVIIVDDGSAVSPIDDLTEHRDEIIYIRQSNQGLSVARNTGIRMATGRYIQFVDGDDELIQAPYEHCLDIVRYHNPDIVSFNLTKSKNNAALSFNFEGPTTGSEYMRRHNLKASACGYIFLRSMLGDTLRFTPGIYHEDEAFTPFLFLRSERLFTTDAHAYYYRPREASITNESSVSHTKKKLDDTERILLHMKSMLDAVPETDKAALNRRIAQLTMDYLYNVIRLTHDRAALDATIDRLHTHGLYPLPDKRYTRKYQLFRRAIESRAMRRLLFLFISAK